jgi:Tol biopolymer transport system component
VAFAARQKLTDPYQIYLRYLDSPVATQITDQAMLAIPLDWTAAGRIVFYSPQAPMGLWSVSPVGGQPEPLLAMAAAVDRPLSASVSRDGKALAWLHRGDEGLFNVWISSPPGAAPKPYDPAPFASRIAANAPTMKFSPDGKQILMIRNAGTGEEAWLMPYPADPAEAPRRILENLPVFGGTPEFSWMPDSRHVVLSTSLIGDTRSQLYLADTVSQEFAVLTSGTTGQGMPAVSPDGSKMVFQERDLDYNIVSIDLTTATAEPLIATQRSEQMPAWTAGEAALVYVTDRGGAPEIWLHTPGQPDRPLVTPRQFPPETTQWFIGPSLSPDARRVIYARSARVGNTSLWISAVAGGSPVPLVKGGAARAPGQAPGLQTGTGTCTGAVKTAASH